MAIKINHKISRLIILPFALLSGIILAPLAQCQQAPQYATSSGNFIIKITNDSESAVPLQNVFVNYSDGPSFLHVPQSQGPIASIAVGAVTNFTFPYTIDANAPDGTYTAHFTVVPQDTLNSESPDGSMLASVDFIRNFLIHSVV
jgi:hypothetical protein